MLLCVSSGQTTGYLDLRFPVIIVLNNRGIFDRKQRTGTILGFIDYGVSGTIGNLALNLSLIHILFWRGTAAGVLEAAGPVHRQQHLGLFALGRALRRGAGGHYAGTGSPSAGLVRWNAAGDPQLVYHLAGKSPR